MAVKYQLVIRSGPGIGRIFPLEGNVITIGRDADNTIVISDAEVSRRHVKLFWQATGYTIEDAGSTNGTFINGQRISAPYALRGGELISLGEDVSLACEASADMDATMFSASKRAAMEIPPETPPVYAGQVPAGPAPLPGQPARKRISIWLIIGIIMLALVCACVLFFVIIDQFQLWCTFFSFAFPAGACP